MPTQMGLVSSISRKERIGLAHLRIGSGVNLGMPKIKPGLPKQELRLPVKLIIN